MKVKDVMVNNVSRCGADDNLAEVAATMWNERCGALPVVDSRGNVTSMITDRDICIALGTRNVRASDLTVTDVALPRVFTCRAEDDVLVPLKTMTSQNVRRLPVVGGDGKLVGILSIDDLLLHSEERPAGDGVFQGQIVSAVKSILKERARGNVHEPAEMIAGHA